MFYTTLHSNEPYQVQVCSDTVHEQEQSLYSLFLIIGLGGLIGMTVMLSYDFSKIDNLQNSSDYINPFEGVV